MGAGSPPPVGVRWLDGDSLQPLTQFVEAHLQPHDGRVKIGSRLKVAEIPIERPVVSGATCSLLIVLSSLYF
jgi:hypothetical protein